MLRLVIEDEPPGPPAVPEEGECVLCFVARMVTAYGCSNQLTFARLWRNRAAPRATALERRLGSRGGYCDCEVLMNGYVLREDFSRRLAGRGPSTADPPPCRGVGRGSSQPCALWMPRSRGMWW